MPRVRFTSHLARHVDCRECEASGDTLRAVIDDVCRQRPQAQGYILDDQHQIRQHVTVFIDGQMLRDRQGLSDQVRADSEVYVMQALSGG